MQIPPRSIDSIDLLSDNGSLDQKGPFEYPLSCLIVISPKVSKPWNTSDRSEIWQTSRQHKSDK